MKVIGLIFLMIYSFDYYGQVLTRRVLDFETNEPVPYSGFFIKGSTRGVNIDSVGIFYLSVSKNDTIVFNSITYPQYEIVNITFNTDTFDIGDLIVAGGTTEFLTYRKGLFRRKVKSNCEIELRFDNIKEENLKVYCPNGKVKYFWERKSVNKFELNFQLIEVCD